MRTRLGTREVKSDAKQVIDQEVKRAAKREVKREVKQEIRQEVRDEAKHELKLEVKRRKRAAEQRVPDITSPLSARGETIRPTRSSGLSSCPGSSSPLIQTPPREETKCPPVLPSSLPTFTSPLISLPPREGTQSPSRPILPPHPPTTPPLSLGPRAPVPETSLLPAFTSPVVSLPPRMRATSPHPSIRHPSSLSLTSPLVPLPTDEGKVRVSMVEQAEAALGKESKVLLAKVTHEPPLSDDDMSRLYRPSTKSIAWKTFLRHPTKPVAWCTLCRTFFAYHNSTTTLKRHVELSHPSVVPEQQSLTDKERNYSILLWLITDLRPLSLVSCKGFLNHSKKDHPHWKPPCSETLRRHASLLYSGLSSQLSALLSTASTVAITTDFWTSIATESYIALSAHFIDASFTLHSRCLAVQQYGGSHTGERIAACLAQLTRRFKLEDRIVACATDNATNMISGVEQLGMEHIPCAAHSLHLAVTQSMKSVTTLLTSARAIGWETWPVVTLRTPRRPSHVSAFSVMQVMSSVEGEHASAVRVLRCWFACTRTATSFLST